MSADAKPFTFQLVEDQSNVRLELRNEAGYTLKQVEVLTIFLKDVDSPGGPSSVHISFGQVSAIRSQENAVLSHQIWVNGKVASAGSEALARLKTIAGQAKPYVLDISWQDPEGKTRFQRIPVGH
ncbi:MAG TPA: hypothetical protein VLL54_19775 [Pyrinomonadaceae bacterium]|nr:hypothetical protein [Pyrinomonadaceae bacterium]